MSALRGWGVAFLAHVAASAGGPGTWLAPTLAVTAMGLVGTWASVAGNELSIRLGRQRVIRLAMTACVVCAAGLGFVGSRSYLLAVLLVLAYGLLVWLDSSSLTAGAAGSADPTRRGATLAMHSMLGYAGGFMGPLVLGFVLDLAGGMSPVGWGLAFAHVAVVVLLGEVAFLRLGPRDLAGDRKVGKAA
jgi:MFS family permease